MDRVWKKDDGEGRKKVTADGPIVESAFSVLLVRNEEYDEGYSKEFNYWIPADCEKLEVILYASEDEFAKYVFEEDGVTLMKGKGKVGMQIRAVTSSPKSCTCL